LKKERAPEGARFVVIKMAAARPKLPFLVAPDYFCCVPQSRREGALFASAFAGQGFCNLPKTNGNMHAAYNLEVIIMRTGFRLVRIKSIGSLE
jgi:hypothetical protein